MLRQRDTVNPLENLRPVVTASRVSDLIAWARAVHIAPALEEYAVALSQATRTHPDLRLGASPRATLQLVRAAKARAHLHGRDWLSPDDVKELAVHVLPHHLVMHDPHARHDDARRVVAHALATTVAPVMR